MTQHVQWTKSSSCLVWATNDASIYPAHCRVHSSRVSRQRGAQKRATPARFDSDQRVWVHKSSFHAKYYQADRMISIPTSREQKTSPPRRRLPHHSQSLVGGSEDDTVSACDYCVACDVFPSPWFHWAKHWLQCPKRNTNFATCTFWIPSTRPWWHSSYS